MLPEDSVILLVEDRGDDVMIILKAFDAAEIKNRVMVTRGGEEAIQYLNGDGMFADRKAYPLPQLILLDLKMPRVDGFEVLKWIRSHPQLKTVPVLVLTLSSDLRDVNTAYQLGANSFMVKPDEFQNVIGLAKLLKDYWLLAGQGLGQMQPPSSAGAESGGT